MTRVVGIDPSLTGTGLAVLLDDRPVQTRTIATKPIPDATLAQRDQRLGAIVDEILPWVAGDTALVVIEGPSLGSHSAHTWDRAGLWWRIVHRLHAYEVPLAVCPPSTRAKWAAGKGNAPKASVVAAVARMWPDVTITDDNVADALALASMAAQQIGLPSAPPTLARHRDPLAAVAWPTNLLAA